MPGNGGGARLSDPGAQPSLEVGSDGSIGWSVPSTSLTQSSSGACCGQQLENTMMCVCIAYMCIIQTPLWLQNNNGDCMIRNQNFWKGKDELR